MWDDVKMLSGVIAVAIIVVPFHAALWFWFGGTWADYVAGWKLPRYPRKDKP